MANRQERRAAQAEERRGRKAAMARATSPLARRILKGVAAWQDEGDLDLVEMGIDDPRFDDAFDALADDIAALLGEDLPEFYADMKAQAMLAHFAVATPDGREMEAQVQMFVLPVHGSGHALGGLMASEEDFGWLVRSFRKFGVAHPEASNVRLVRGLLDPQAMVEASPWAIRQAVKALVPSLVPGPDGLPATGDDEIILEMLGGDATPDGGPPAGEVTVLDRGLVGVRLLVVDPEAGIEAEDMDYLSQFMPAEIARKMLLEDDDGMGLDEPDAGAPDDFDELDDNEPILVWTQEVLDRFAGKGVLVSEPQEWAEATGAMALNRVKGMLAIEQAMLGIDPGTEPDRCHVHFGQDAAWVGLEFGDRLIGPVDVGMLMIIPDMDRFQDALVEMAPEIVMHDTERTLLDLRGRGGPAPGRH